ncbi:sensor histidine kinase [Nonomuraea soli]|uniref:histidine kinase n=1 Tax=Nonomuraea soli TaxID=1032476 RepID=A0A7W0CND9_9ACTN|nr:histidine kinase [Nonomuraea soli]MBA2894140.1 signal transduction histidine kinase [Nonomuraea soli]
MDRTWVEFPARHPLLMDLSWLVPWTVLCVFTSGGDDDMPATLPAELAVCAGLLVPLLWRRRFPMTVFAVVAGVTLLQIYLRWPILLANLGACVALFGVASRCSLAKSLVAAGVALVGQWLWVVRYPDSDTGPMAGSTAVLVVLLWLGGRFVQAKRQGTMALRESLVLAEEARQREARYAAVRERMELARELHDTVAHNVSVMILQAEAVRQQPALAVRAMEVIASAGRAALADMRSLVGTLSEEPPVPWSALVADAVEAVERSGLKVHSEVDGPPCDARWAEVYPVVREGLTNALKYAGPGAQVRLSIRFGPEQTEVSLEDDGGGSPLPMPPGGHGLAGLQERVLAGGGTFSAGPGEARGYRVVATMPRDHDGR